MDYPQISSFLPFLARVHTTLVQHSLGPLLRVTPFQTEPHFPSEHMLLFTNYFGLHGLVHVINPPDGSHFTCGYVMKSFFRLCVGPNITCSDRGIACDVPAFSAQQHVSFEYFLLVFRTTHLPSENSILFGIPP